MRLCLVASTLALVFVSTATASSGWTPATAAARVKATYTTIDQKAFDYAQEHDLVSAMERARHGAKPTGAACKGVGKGSAGLFSAFHCTVTVQGDARIPPDYVLYTGTRHVTVRIAGSRWRILNGWR